MADVVIDLSPSTTYGTTTFFLLRKINILKQFVGVFIVVSLIGGYRDGASDEPFSAPRSEATSAGGGGLQLSFFQVTTQVAGR